MKPRIERPPLRSAPAGPWLLVVMLGWIPASRAQVPTAEARPKRPLTLDADTLELSAGVKGGWTFNDQDTFRELTVPLGLAWGATSGWELGADLMASLHPSTHMALALGTRVAPGADRTLGVGLLVTLPLGYATDRLGPSGLPLRLELPALRLESSRAALLALVTWDWMIQEDPDTYGVAAACAGLLRVQRKAFAIVEMGANLPGFDPEVFSVTGSLGFGAEIVDNLVLKAVVTAPDMGQLDIWQAQLLVVKLIEKQEEYGNSWI